MRRRIAITGVGAVTALGVGADVLHRRAVAGECGVEDGVGLCRDFKPMEFFSRKEAHRTDRFCQFALMAGAEAMQQAGWGDTPPYAPGRVACIIGSGVGGLASLETQLEVLREQGGEYVSPLMVPMMMANAAAAQLTMKYGLHGESHCVISACSAGTQSIGAGMPADVTVTVEQQGEELADVNVTVCVAPRSQLMETPP